MRITLTLLAFVVGFAAFAQDPMYSTNEKAALTTGTTPQKKDNVIIIKTGLSAEEAFMQWGRHLLQNGYTIAESNKDFLTLDTGPKDTSKMNYAILLNSSVQENGDILVRAKWQLKSSIIANTRASEFHDWSYRGPGEVTTKDILATVSSFGDYPVTYAKQ